MSTKEQPGSAVTIITGIDVRTRIATAVVVPSKSVYRYEYTELKRCIYEPGRTQAILQCDDENAIKAVRRAASQDAGGLTGRLAPTGSSQSQGSVERWHQTLLSQGRALRLALVSRFQLPVTDLPVTHPFMPWIVMHATWLLNRYLIHDAGLSSYQRRCKQQSMIGIADFGEIVYCKAQGKHDVAKAESSFAKGMWLGRDSDSSEHQIATSRGIIKSRTIKRVIS